MSAQLLLQRHRLQRACKPPPMRDARVPRKATKFGALRTHPWRKESRSLATDHALLGATHGALLDQAFMCRWLVNVPWLLGIDVVQM